VFISGVPAEQSAKQRYSPSIRRITMHCLHMDMSSSGRILHPMAVASLDSLDKQINEVTFVRRPYEGPFPGKPEDPTPAAYVCFVSRRWLSERTVRLSFPFACSTILAT
jgi:hypothetical protein